MNRAEETMLPAQEDFVRRFVAACEADARVIAAFLGGSHAAGTADRYSDLDLYLVTAEEEYGAFFVDRFAFVRQLGRPVFCEDFSEFGFDMVLFIFDDGMEGELAIAPESRFKQTHGGPFQALVDKRVILADAVFPLYHPAADAQQQALRRAIYWFWRDLSLFIKAMARGRLWAAAAQLNAMRRNVIQLALLRHDFSLLAEGYDRLDVALPPAQLTALSATFGPLERNAMLGAAGSLVKAYRQIAPAPARGHQIDYPTELERVMAAKFAELR